MQIAQKVWNGIANRRYCPSDSELADLVARMMDDEPQFVYDNALRRLRGHIRVLRAIIDFEPKGVEAQEMKDQDIRDLHDRPFFEEFVFPDEVYKYP